MTAPTSSPLPSYDLFAPEVLMNQTPLMHRIRAENPLAWIPQMHSWLLTRHADILAVLKDRRFAPSNMAGWMGRLTPAEQEELLPMRKSIELWMGHTNEKDHLRFQLLLKRYFTPTTVDGLRPRVREFTEELLELVKDRGGMDVVKDLAYPLPANVIAEMLGVPTRDREQLQLWSRDITAIFTPSSDIHQLRRCQRSVLEMQDYMRPIIAERRREPRQDLISILVAAEKEGAIHSEEEIVTNCVLLLFAGHETTANLIANGLVLLFENPEQFEQLKAKPELMPSAVEEMLRCDGPAGAITRVNTEPVELAGRALPPGQHIFLALSAGNRDPEVFPDPDRFDITRKPNRHMAFGMGAFYCLGAALARMEADECFRVLLRRFPNIRPAYQTPDWRPTPPIGHHLETLHVKF
ncbi:cytochrome P450 [Archangium violaceum]|uniref:cytochrome P450 n=1 Tax=Archangium violaceum TaxID=83451 RepID=UPI0019519137|nr:cytochrome P450 [Archangium violaceum]QRN95544.1 cytochrome P450 [Archangium violaceum]